jgi:hypothetical protein
MNNRNWFCQKSPLTIDKMIKFNWAFFVGNYYCVPGFNKVAKTLAVVLLILFSSFYSLSQECKKFNPVVLAQYIVNGKSGLKTGFEAGYIGMNTNWGYTAGFIMEFHEPGSGEDVANATGDMFRMFLKGSYRVHKKENRRMIYLTLSPELNMSGRFDLMGGVRFLFPFSGKIGLGIEPGTSLLYGDLHTNLQLFFRL